MRVCACACARARASASERGGQRERGVVGAGSDCVTRHEDGTDIMRERQIDIMRERQIEQ